MINIQRIVLYFFSCLHFPLVHFEFSYTHFEMSINIKRKQQTFLSKNFQNSYTQQRNKASSTHPTLSHLRPPKTGDKTI